MQYEFVEVKTAQHILLNGFYAHQNNNACAVFIPGLAGNFMEQHLFAHVLGQECLKNNIDFLFAHHQGSFQIMSFPHLDEDGTRSNIIRGAAYENFDDCVYDLDAWIQFVSKYDKVYLMCHSLGCNKVVHYLQSKTPQNLAKLVLLAPQDNVNFPNLPIHQEMLKEAKENTLNGSADKLLTNKLFGFCVISSKTFFDLMTNIKINNIPYKAAQGDLPALQNIQCPTLAIIGSKEDEKATEYMQKIANALPHGKSAVIPNANHMFKNQEKALADTVISFLLA